MLIAQVIRPLESGPGVSVGAGGQASDTRDFSLARATSTVCSGSYHPGPSSLQDEPTWDARPESRPPGSASRGKAGRDWRVVQQTRSIYRAPEIPSQLQDPGPLASDKGDCDGDLGDVSYGARGYAGYQQREGAPRWKHLRDAGNDSSFRLDKRGDDYSRARVRATKRELPEPGGPQVGRPSCPGVCQASPRLSRAELWR